MSPWAPARACRAPLCPNRVPSTVKGGYCPVHSKQKGAAAAAYNREKRVPHDPRNTARWQRWRAQILRERPVCERCNDALSTTVHHQGGGGTDPALCFDLSRLVALCSSCHAKAEAEERKSV